MPSPGEADLSKRESVVDRKDKSGDASASDSKMSFRTANNVRIVPREPASRVASAFLKGEDTELPVQNAELPSFVRQHDTVLTFPEKLMIMMNYIERSNLPDPPISWVLNGSAIAIQSGTDLEEVLRRFFGPGKCSSFTRKLHRWGFRLAESSAGVARAGKVIYGNEFFQRDSKNLMVNMKSMTSVGKKLAAKKNEKKRQGRGASSREQGVEIPVGRRADPHQKDSPATNPRHYENELRRAATLEPTVGFRSGTASAVSGMQPLERGGRFEAAGLKKCKQHFDAVDARKKRTMIASNQSQQAADHDLNLGTTPFSGQLAGRTLVPNLLQNPTEILQPPSSFLCYPDILQDIRQYGLQNQGGLHQISLLICGGLSTVPSSLFQDLQQNQLVHVGQQVQRDAIFNNRLRMLAHPQLVPTLDGANNWLASAALRTQPTMTSLSLQAANVAADAGNVSRLLSRSLATLYLSYDSPLGTQAVNPQGRVAREQRK